MYGLGGGPRCVRFKNLTLQPRPTRCMKALKKKPKGREITTKHALQAWSACTLPSPSTLELSLRKTAPPVYMITQLQPCDGGAYGSSPLPTGPQTDGTWADNLLVDESDTVDEDVPNDPWLSCNILSDCEYQPTRRRKARPARMASRKARVPKGEKEVSVMIRLTEEKGGRRRTSH